MSLAEYLKPMSLEERNAFARRAGTTYLHLRNVAFSGKPCGVPLAVAVERESGGKVPRWVLRPNDWHLNWPDLAQRAGQGGVPALLVEVRDAA
jgi:hypothetical protein